MGEVVLCCQLHHLQPGTLPSTQLNIYRLTYIAPLTSCPSYYDMLHSAVQEKLGSAPAGKMSYSEAEKMVCKSTVFRCYHKEYTEFRKKVEEMPFFKEVIYLPPCRYLHVE